MLAKRGGCIDGIDADLEKVSILKPAYLFLEFGKNDICHFQKNIPALIGIFVLYGILVNSLPAFADTMNQIPLLGEINHVFLLSSYSKEDKTYLLKVSYPKIKDIKNSALEANINRSIQDIIDQLVECLEKEEQIAKQAFEEENIPYVQRHVTIDYKVTCCNDRYLSFFLQLTEEQNQDYVETFHYNLDQKRGKNLTLNDLYGADYQNIINTQLHTQMKARMEQNPSLTYYIDGYEEPSFLFSGIKENQSFFLDENEQVNILFQSYEVAPGYMGAQVFTIKLPYDNQ